MSYYKSYLRSSSHSLENVEATDRGQNRFEEGTWLDALCELTEGLKKAGGRMFFAGNGASAAFCSHMSLDWSKNGGVPCVPLFDPAHLTALGNDLGFDHVFSTAIGWHGRQGDLLVTVSSSGNSPNVLLAIEKARDLGMGVVTLSGLKPDNRSRLLGDVNLYVPAKTYGIVECAHQILLHAWLDCSMNVFEWERDGFQNMNANEFEL